MATLEDARGPSWARELNDAAIAPVLSLLSSGRTGPRREGAPRRVPGAREDRGERLDPLPRPRRGGRGLAPRRRPRGGAPRGDRGARRRRRGGGRGAAQRDPDRRGRAPPPRGRP